MRTVTLYHRASGTPICHVGGVEFSDYETTDVGVYPDVADLDDEYIVAGSPLQRQPRTAATITVPADVSVGDTVTITGLPQPCWLRVRSEFVEVAGGSVTFTPTVDKAYTVEFAGAYRGSATVVVKSVDQAGLEADPRWQALQGATPQQVEDWLTNNVTSFASARQVLKILLLAVKKLGAQQ